jgi:hypothetical protein
MLYYKYNLHLSYTNYTNYTNYTKLHNYTKDNTITKEDILFFEKVKKTGIIGRQLEVWLPLFFISKHISEEILDETLRVAGKMVDEKKVEELVENKDISFLKFLSLHPTPNKNETTPIKDLTKEFKEYMSEEEEEVKLANTQWVGRALKRLNLISGKRRLKRGVEVVVNYKKAREKIRVYLTKEQIEELDKPKEEDVELKIVEEKVE